MNITILGAGNMGSALAKQLARAGHRVRITARDGEKAKAVAAANPGASAVPAATALTGSEVVFLATGFADAIAALRSLGSLEGKIIIDITNPLTPDFMGLTVGFSSSAAEETAKALIESIGFKAVDAGGLKNARYLEPLGGLNIYFGYGAGQGTAIAPTWIRKA